MPPIAIVERVLLLFVCIGVTWYVVVWFFRFLAGAWLRYKVAQVENKIEVDEKETDVKIKKMRGKKK